MRPVIRHRRARLWPASTFVLAACPLLAPAAEAAELLGPAPASIVVPEGPVQLDVADLNGDGVLDMALAAVSNFSLEPRGVVSLLMGDGLGGFTRTADLDAGHRPLLVRIADFDSDGVPDLVVVNRISDSITIHLGDGQGGFSRAELQAGDDPRALALADFNTDGAIDIVVSNYLDNTVSVFLGDGAGGFTRTADLPVGAGPFKVAAADFDDDGLIDLAVANQLGDNVGILLGDGLGGFSLAGVFGAGSSPTPLVVSDFNGDGALDLAVGNLFTVHDAPNVRTLLGDGRGGFSLGAEISVSRGLDVNDLAVGDFNADGVADLAATAFDSVDILLGDGLGGFSQSSDLQVGRIPVGLALSDFNADGVPDLAVCNRASDTVSIHLGNGLGGFPPGTRSRLEQSPQSLVVSDFNKDGSVDLAMAGWDVQSHFDGSVRVVLGDGAGGFVQSADLIVAPSYPDSLAVSDFNSDSNPDLAVVWTNFDTLGGARILFGDGLGGFSMGPPLSAGLIPNTVLASDFNGDGAADLAVTDRGRDRVTILLGDGSGSFARVADVPVGDEPSYHAAADLNADGAVDLVVPNQADDSVSILLGDGQGGFSRTADVPVGDGPHFVAIADLDADSRPDLAVSSLLDGLVIILLGDGSGGFQLAAALPGLDAYFMGAFDFNADGLMDLAITSEDRSGAIIFAGDGQGGFSPVSEVQVGPFPRSGAISDINGDGAPDLVVGSHGSMVVTDGPLDPGSSVSVLFNQLSSRVDLNGTNRVDGFDLGEVSRAAGCAAADPCYRRAADVDLNGVVDGDDLSQLRSAFGELIRTASPLRATFQPAGPVPPPDSAGFVQDPAGGDLLAVGILVTDADDPVAGADFAVTFDSQVLGYAGFDPGKYLAGGGVLSVYDVQDLSSEGRVGIRVSRLPPSETLCQEVECKRLMSLLFRARREGQTALDFAPHGRTQPAFLDAQDQEVAGIAFVGGAGVTVQALAAGGPPGQRIAVPALLEFGRADGTGPLQRSLRIGNLGFSDLTIESVSSLTPEFGVSFGGPFRIPAFGYVELPVRLAAAAPGMYSGELRIGSDDPSQSEARVVLRGMWGLDIVVSPQQVDFGVVPPGGARTERVVVRNVGAAGLVLDGLESSDARLTAEAGFAALAPGQSGLVTARFRPVSEGPFEGALRLRLTGSPQAVLTVNVTAQGGPDTDGDGLGDPIDNCPLVANSGQDDGDADAVGDACDICPSTPDPDQLDGDGDLLGDACDNCPAVPDPDQTDPDEDDVGSSCDNCPEDFNPLQEDRNADGSGDACQPDLEILDIRQDGGADLEVTVRLEDPQPDPIAGSVRIYQIDTMADWFLDFDCTAPLPPERMPGEGIGFGDEGFIGETHLILFDVDSIFFCQDGVADYEVALGTCATPASAFGLALEITGVTPPQPICIRRVDLSSEFDLTIFALDSGPLSLELGLLAIETAYQDSALPAGIDLSSLAPGPSRLEITASDGTTPPVMDRRDFVLQGETVLLFLPP